MGNNRQLLKDNIQNDLQKKIRTAESILSQLKDAVASVEKNSEESKLELQQNVDSLQQLLALRKQEITRQIDLHCHAQTNALQEGIRSTYITLGSLQSTLSHLDSIDHSQLINLQAPDISWMQNVTTPPQLETALDSSKLSEEIANWGSVSANSKGFKSLDFSDSRSDGQLTCRKSISAGSTSSLTFKTQPKMSHQITSAVANKAVARPQSQMDCQDKWHLEQWLDEIKSDTVAENDDFEFVSFETERTITPKTHETSAATRTTGRKESESNMTEDGSSIVCIEEENSKTTTTNFDEPLTNDLSQWLKPKKTAVIPTPSEENVTVAPVQVGNKRPNATTNTFIDFPCLQMDPNCWIRETKKNKRCFSTELRNSVTQKEIIPPTYALPNPFWLKRFC